MVYNKGQGEMPDGLYVEIVCVFMSVCMGRSEGWWETHVCSCVVQWAVCVHMRVLVCVHCMSARRDHSRQLLAWLMADGLLQLPWPLQVLRLER